MLQEVKIFPSLWCWQYHDFGSVWNRTEASSQPLSWDCHVSFTDRAISAALYESVVPEDTWCWKVHYSYFFFKKIFMKLRFWNFIFKVFFFFFPLKGLYIITKWNPLLECENGSTDKTQSTWYVILIERRKATKIISADPTNESDRRKSYFHLS